MRQSWIRGDSPVPEFRGELFWKILIFQISWVKIRYCYSSQADPECSGWLNTSSFFLLFFMFLTPHPPTSLVFFPFTQHDAQPYDQMHSYNPVTLRHAHTHNLLPGSCSSCGPQRVDTTWWRCFECKLLKAPIMHHEYYTLLVQRILPLTDEGSYSLNIPHPHRMWPS